MHLRMHVQWAFDLSTSMQAAIVVACAAVCVARELCPVLARPALVIDLCGAAAAIAVAVCYGTSFGMQESLEIALGFIDR